MRGYRFTQILLAVTIILISFNANARHLKLYTYDIADVGDTVATYSLDWISGSAAGTQSGNPMFHEIEIEHAFTKRWMQSFYIDYDYRGSTSTSKEINEITSIKTEFNLPFSEKGEHYFDFRLNIELAMALNDKINAYGETDAADTAEFRFIFEKNFEKYTLILGPMFVQNISGPKNLGGPSFGFANAILFDISDRVSGGLELHSFLGEGRDIDNINVQSHTLVPNVDFAINDQLSVSLGVGLGLTDSADDFTLRTAIAYVFEGAK